MGIADREWMKDWRQEQAAAAESARRDRIEALAGLAAKLGVEVDVEEALRAGIAFPDLVQVALADVTADRTPPPAAANLPDLLAALGAAPSP